MLASPPAARSRAFAGEFTGSFLVGAGLQTRLRSGARAFPRATQCKAAIEWPKIEKTTLDPAPCLQSLADTVSVGSNW